MSSSASSPESAATAATSTTSPTEGVLWVTTSILNKDLPESLIHEWYREHSLDVLNCPGNGGLFLRYKNVDSSINLYSDPNFAGRFAPSTTLDVVANAQWPFLALVKLTDLAWLISQQFIDMPRVSKVLPPQADGSLGSAFDAWNAGLRSYETVNRVEGTSSGTGRPQYILSVQTEEASGPVFEELEKTYSTLPGFRRSVSYKLAPGFLEFQEPGPLPQGLALYEFDGDQPPSPSTSGKHIKADVWTLISEQGDLSLNV